MREQLARTWHLFTTFGTTLDKENKQRGKSNNCIKLVPESEQSKQTTGLKTQTIFKVSNNIIHYIVSQVNYSILTCGQRLDLNMHFLQLSFRQLHFRGWHNYFVSWKHQMTKPPLSCGFPDIESE